MKNILGKIMGDFDKKKMIKLGIIIIGVFVLLIILLLVFHSLTANRSNSYQDIENKMLNAAKKYYKKNENLLPQTSNEQVTIDDVSLTSLGYLKSLTELVKKEGVTCTGKVVISYNNDRYRYTPLLDCGNAYKTETLASHIEATVERVYSGTGLYDLNGEYVYRGEEPNNYVKFADHNYRIIKIVDGNVVLILNERSERSTWDDRYNSNRDDNDGINDYTVSRIKEYLDKAYIENEFVNESGKSLIVKHDLYIGKRKESDNYNDGSIEKSEVLENQYIGLLPLYDYINASIDQNCNSAITDSCTNYNYLNYYNYNWWTITADSTNTFRAYRISNYGTIDTVRGSSIGFVRPVIYLINDAIYVSGDGTKDNPYTVK